MLVDMKLMVPDFTLHLRRVGFASKPESITVTFSFLTRYGVITREYSLPCMPHLDFTQPLSKMIFDTLNQISDPNIMTRSFEEGKFTVGVVMCIIGGETFPVVKASTKDPARSTLVW